MTGLFCRIMQLCRSLRICTGVFHSSPVMSSYTKRGEYILHQTTAMAVYHQEHTESCYFVIHSDYHIALQAFVSLNKSHPVARKIQDWLTLVPSRKIILCRVPALFGILENELVDERAKTTAASPKTNNFPLPHLGIWFTSCKPKDRICSSKTMNQTHKMGWIPREPLNIAPGAESCAAFEKSRHRHS